MDYPRRLRPLRLGFRSNSSIIACSSIAETDTETSSTASNRPVSINLVYVPTPTNQDTRTPHSGITYPVGILRITVFQSQLSLSICVSAIHLWLAL
uniref:Uncharacterized protein n=1 Tax=Gossypium raimondii TaxID=29730 RepID=A0A0D2VIC3_GOSRA|nr:hypothetical protein B456_013G211800 [Gossypium raimondii]